MLNKIKRESFPFFDDWCEIYGTDIAKGGGASGFGDAADRVLGELDAESDEEAAAGQESGQPSGAATPEPSFVANSGTRRHIPDEVDSNSSSKRGRNQKETSNGDNGSPNFENMISGIGNLIKEACDKMTGPIVVNTPDRKSTRLNSSHAQ